MKAAAFTRGSPTTSENKEGTFREYFQGQFVPVENTASKLEEHAEVELHLLSDEYGYVKGSDSVEDYQNQKFEPEQARKELADALISTVSESDVVLILLPTEEFEEIVAANWQRIVGQAKPDSIWCIATSRSALESIDINELEEKGCEVLEYQRVGVARISYDIRNQLIERIEGIRAS